MPQYQGVWTLEQQAQAQSNQQWVTDPNFKNTTLLLQADGTGSGSQNQTFLDGSTNNFFITRNGNTTQGSFSPFSQAPGYWSNYFDGTDDFYTSSTALFNYTIANASTQTATIEALVYITALQSAPANIWENPCIAGKGDVYMNFGVNASGNLFMYHISGGTARNTISSSTVPLNTWNYVAAVISGGTITLYINGVASGSGTWFGIDAAGQNSTSYFGETPDADSRAWLGYISNLRVSTTARTITVPTSPYVNDGNTAFLTFQSNRVVDNSSNAYAITASGTPSVQAFGPFAPALQWTPDVVGGSGYFDGTGDYLNLSGQSAFAFGSSASFTIQFWFYATAISADVVFYDGRPTSTQGLYPTLFLNNSTKVISYTTNSTEVITGTTTITTGQWYYVTLTRNSGSTRLFVNGVQQGSTYSDTINYANPASRPTIMQSGFASNGYLTGYVSGFQVLNGTGYSSVTVPTSPPTAITNTSLLLNMTNAGIYDGKMANNLETVGNAQVSTSVVKYGSGSMYFPGATTDYLSIPDKDLLEFGTASFTVEAWVFPTLIAGDERPIWSHGTNSSNWMSLYITSSGYVEFAAVATSTIVDVTTPVTVPLSTWTHIALVRNNNIFKIYINGIDVGSSSSPTTTSSAIGSYSDSFRVGGPRWSGGSDAFQGFIDDLRITLAARYFTTFTPPQQALPRQ